MRKATTKLRGGLGSQHDQRLGAASGEYNVDDAAGVAQRDLSEGEYSMVDAAREYNAISISVEYLINKNGRDAIPTQLGLVLPCLLSHLCVQCNAE